MKAGDLVRLRGKRTTAYVKDMLGDIRGGVLLEKELGGMRYWNVADLEVVPRRKTTSLADRIADADARGGRWLADANEAADKGNHAKAEKLYAKGQFWLDRSNKLRGMS